MFKIYKSGQESNEVIFIKEDFIKLEMHIPINDIRNLILDISSTLKDLSITNSQESKFIFTKNTELFTIMEVSHKLKVNKNTVYNLIKAGHLSALKLGALKVTSTELERFLNNSNDKDFTNFYNVKDLKFNKD